MRLWSLSTAALAGQANALSQPRSNGASSKSAHAAFAPILPSQRQVASRVVGAQPQLLRAPGGGLALHLSKNQNEFDAVDSDQTGKALQSDAESTPCDQGSDTAPLKDDASQGPGCQLSDEHSDKIQPKVIRGLNKIGDRVGSMLKRTSDGNRMKLDIDDRLQACYPACPVDKIKYTMNHDDFSGQRWLKVDTEFADHDDSTYHKMMRDTVFAEWVSPEEGDADAPPELQIKMHLTKNQEGEGPLWESWLKSSKLPPSFANEIVQIGGEMRKGIFKSHSEDAIEVIFAAIKDLIADNPQLVDSPVTLHYLSDYPALQEIVDSETVGFWLEKLKDNEQEGNNKLSLDALTKNIKVWKEAADSANIALDRFMVAAMEQLRSCAKSEMVQLLSKPGVAEWFVLMIILANDTIGKNNP